MADNSRHFTGVSTDSIIKTNPSGILTNAAFTFGCWLYLNSIEKGILQVGPSSCDILTRGASFWVDGSGKLAADNSSGTDIRGATTVTTATWHRAGMTHSGSGVATGKVILDGVEDGSGAMDPATEITTGDVFYVGAKASPIGLPEFNGRMAWAFWLQGVVLTAAQIDTYLNDPQKLVTDYGPSGGVTASALKILWPMQCAGSTEVDKSGAGNDGAISGTTLGSGDGPSPTTDWTNVCSSTATLEDDVWQSCLYIPRFGDTMTTVFS